mmetsp:Transcript_3729/g.10010  ORF Transcript_3729/g.10010 Transcript_3729/m.10010 type:complete len:208 (-) Transcript_3729:120-743(-)
MGLGIVQPPEFLDDLERALLGCAQSSVKQVYVSFPCFGDVSLEGLQKELRFRGLLAKEEWKLKADKKRPRPFEKRLSPLKQHGLERRIETLQERIEAWKPSVLDEIILLLEKKASGAARNFATMPKNERDHVLVNWTKRLPMDSMSTRKESMSDRNMLTERVRRQIELILEPLALVDSVGSNDILAEPFASSPARLYVQHFNNIYAD